ncbi:uncharacterized protein BO97DRAFT_422784 [Aspergillus homomorphus CBS 101889]|uniref:Uncharacterized protein n=1 Tax=Aspergillus homomorphus (strain CBS 101889) TaxID=1450537 RepID=A0A395I3P6_ASPHC|nr:hypothetical protein BO97DRAFT_422784 [Aspergillus homomorphus CBS 101889]RAL14365.1 hypothetical protein BO97DRAFT_422784 [Aspergillus homomorphus CBS 101889]
MKLTLVFTTLLSASSVYAVSQKVTQAEYNDWEHCLTEMLGRFDQGDSGDGPTCDYWTCLHGQASKYGRGGILTGTSNALTAVCGVDNLANHVAGWFGVKI